MNPILIKNTKHFEYKTFQNKFICFEMFCIKKKTKDIWKDATFTLLPDWSKTTVFNQDKQKQQKYQ